jgi:YidC/Oxa1 family membrane protein insertase
MPIMFTFIMAPFAVGLLIYWTWSNVLTTLQQYVIMRRFKVDNPIDQLIARFTGKPRRRDRRDGRLRPRTTGGAAASSPTR